MSELTKSEKRFFDLVSSCLKAPRRPVTKKELAFVRPMGQAVDAYARENGVELREDGDDPSGEFAIDDTEV